MFCVWLSETKLLFTAFVLSIFKLCCSFAYFGSFWTRLVLEIIIGNKKKIGLVTIIWKFSIWIDAHGHVLGFDNDGPDDMDFALSSVPCHTLSFVHSNNW